MNWKKDGARLFGMKEGPTIDNSHGDIYFFLDIARAPYHYFVFIGCKHLVVMKDMLKYVVRNYTFLIRGEYAKTNLAPWSGQYR